VKNLRLKNLPRQASCLIALSGGGDSVALLDLVSRISAENSLTLSAAKVMHGIRTEEEELAEASLCEKLCRERSVPFRILHADGESVVSIQEKYSCGPEQAAREFRQKLLKTHLNEIGADYLLFGHTADDNLETIFMRLLSGSGPEGLAGISSRKNSIIRPMLGISRSELRDYLDSRKIQWMEDRTNQENTYRRNRMRNELIPLVTEIFPGWEKALGTLGERAMEATVSLNKSVSTFIPCKNKGNKSCWKESDWDSSPEYLKALLLWNSFNFLENSGIPDRQLPWRSLKEARKSLNEKRSWNAFGLSLERTGGNITMSRVEASINQRGRILLTYSDVSDDFSVVLGKFRVKTSLKKASGWKCIKMNNEEWPLDILLDSGGHYPEFVKRGITEKKAMKKSTDSQGILVYIFIEPVKEGFNAG